MRDRSWGREYTVALASFDADGAFYYCQNDLEQCCGPGDRDEQGKSGENPAQTRYCVVHKALPICHCRKVRRRQCVRSQETYNAAKGFVDAKNPG